MFCSLFLTFWTPSLKKWVKTKDVYSHDNLILYSRLILFRANSLRDISDQGDPGLRYMINRNKQFFFSILKEHKLILMVNLLIYVDYIRPASQPIKISRVT